MVNIRQAMFGVAASAAIALLPIAPAMAGGPGFRPFQPFGYGHGIVGAAAALATLPLAIASSVLSSVGGSASYPTQGYAGGGYGYAPPVAYAPPRPYYAPYAGYRGAPHVGYGPRAYYAPHPGYYGHGYYRSGGDSHPRR